MSPFGLSIISDNPIFGYFVIFDLAFFFEPPIFHYRVSLLRFINTHDYFTFVSFVHSKNHSFRRPAELSPAELINKIIKIPKHIPDYDKSEFRSRQHVMSRPRIFVSTYQTYIFLARSWVS